MSRDTGDISPATPTSEKTRRSSFGGETRLPSHASASQFISDAEKKGQIVTAASGPPLDTSDTAADFNETGGINVNALRSANDGSDRKILREEDCYRHLGFCFPLWKKWMILTVLFVVQISMNWNAAVYPNAVPGVAEHFNVTPETARLSQMIFLVTYAFGCELWAPWSEELGRKWVLQGSLFLVNIWIVPCITAQNYWTIFAARFLGGLSSAGGSVTLGVVADMYEPDQQQFAVAFVVLGSVGAAVITAICGGVIQQYLEWRWIFIISLIFGGLTQLVQLFFVPETRSSILVTRQAKRLRRKGFSNVYSEDEVRGETLWKRLNWRECCVLMWRPYQFLIKEPIVRYLSLLSGFSDALIFSGLDSFGMVLDKWNFNHLSVGLSFIPLLLSYLVAYAWFCCDYRIQRRLMQEQKDDFSPERRLWLLLFTAPLLFVGLFGFAWVSLGPPQVHWIAPLLFTVPIGIANFAVYMATIDYMIAAYGPFSASATGGNGFCRDLLAGLAGLYTHPFYTNIARGSTYQLAIPSLILSGIAVILIIPVYFCYWKGPQIRAKSKYACELAHERAEHREERDYAISVATTPIHSPPVSRPGSRHSSRPVSRETSPIRRQQERKRAMTTLAEEV